MPCYDPPPPWEGEAKESAEEAVKLLCENIQTMLNSDMAVRTQWLIWYIKHRQIDFQIATVPYFSKVDLEAAARARHDINRAIKQLEE